ncbi:MAG: carboxypeptidase-like regulatory domain-containing protein, partial [Ilumatobacteraceae bacterium]
GVAVVATDGTIEVSTVTLTVDDVGFYAVRALPTPGQYTLTYAKEGYESATRTVTLAAGQQLPDLGVMLAPTTGSISGTVSEDLVGPAGGITVSIAGPDIDFSTTTTSGDPAGVYFFEQLPVPATYTLTYTKPGLVSQTRLVDLDPLNGSADVSGVDATMIPSTAVVGGIVRNAAGSPLAGAAVALSNGTDVRQVRSATDPLGAFEFSAVDPGAYTLTASLPGTTPAVLLVNVLAADVTSLDVTLEAQASLFGQVTLFDEATQLFLPYEGATVRLFLAEDFPGIPSQAQATATTGADGSYNFPALAAPDDFVVAVYGAATSSDALDSILVQTQPSVAREVPTFQLRQAS